MAQSLGVDIGDIALSRKTIHRARTNTRMAVSIARQKAFSSDGPVVLHWDGKLLPDITGSKQLVDRVAIIVTGEKTEQLLAVSKIKRGTGEEQCNACLQALEEWHLKPLVQGLLFDTTASNTGLKMGACTLLEKALESWQRACMACLSPSRV